MADPLTEITSRHRTSGVLVDTNILLLLLVGRLDRRLIGYHGFKRTRQFSPEDFDLLVGFLKRFSRILVTPHILAEVASLGNQLGEPARSKFFRLLAIALPELEEHYRESQTFLDVGEHIYPRLGLTDSLTSLVAGTTRLVLTDDLRLSIELASQSCDVVNFSHLRPVE